MKNFITMMTALTLVVGGYFAFAGDQIENTSVTRHIGRNLDLGIRFQITQGITIQHNRDGTEKEVPVLFKIDTLLGNTWVYEETRNGNNIYRRWVEIR